MLETANLPATRLRLFQFDTYARVGAVLLLDMGSCQPLAATKTLGR